ncbi:MAG: hypothetical protein V4672_14315 [Verrucomicrobiota bacterium]
MKLWDADSLARSVSEGTIRFLFLCHGNEADRGVKLHEYGILLPLFSSLKQHKRAKEIIAKNPNFADPLLKPFKDMILPEEEIQRIQNEYPRKFRQRIEQRWAFMEICDELQRDGDLYFAEIFHLHHPYGMSSHIIHQDRIGTGMVIERMRRSDERRHAVELAHAARLVYDVFIYATARAFALYRANKLDPEPIINVYKKFGPIRQEIETAYQSFYEIEYASST